MSFYNINERFALFTWSSSWLYWMNIFLNEYFGFCFELNFELNHFLARFNEKMNFQNESGRAKIKGLTISVIGILGWAILVVLSWVCCYCHSRYYFVLGKRSFCPRRRAKLHLELPGKHIPTRTLLVTLSHIIKHEKHGEKARSILGCIWANNYSQLHAEYVKLSLLAMSLLSRNGNTKEQEIYSKDEKWSLRHNLALKRRPANWDMFGTQ